MVFDFDDDNALMFTKEVLPSLINPIPSRPLNDLVDEATLPVPNSQSRFFEVSWPPVLNPYPVMGSSNVEAWPRGFPLDRITSSETFDASRKLGAVPFDKVRKCKGSFMSSSLVYYCRTQFYHEGDNLAIPCKPRSRR